MPVLAAVAVIPALYLLVAAPAGLAFLRPKATVPIVAIYITVLVGLAYSQVGFISAKLSIAAGSKNAPIGSYAPDEATSLCGQAIRQAKLGKLILDDARPPRVVVDGRLWAQIPQQAKDGLVACLNKLRPAAADEKPVEIIENPQ